MSRTPPRQTRSRTALLLSLGWLVPAVALAPLLAWGDGAKKPVDAATAASNREYANDCAQGNIRYAAHDFDGAIALYRKAVELAPRQATGHYFLGEAQLAAGNLTEAEASWGRALEASDRDPSLHARVLFVLADLKERQRKWDDAKTAWQAYLDWADKHPNASAFPTSALSRQQILDAVIKQDKQDEVVRQRIAANLDGGVFSDPSKSPPASK
jgi:tetratricopeptide (TPR) repeat protein